ncbi:DUF262 domain-containing protein [Poriferisphaera sp. WC338]|uniref:DUF262 domain-containing protein n=1 Tax=Poriferisphaera sp. WC338 TaxID=3425129 RepID=UPI003D81AAD3
MSEWQNEDMDFDDPREEEEIEIDEIPKGERRLRTQAYDKSIFDIVEMINRGDICLDPDYQRNYIWDDRRASLLVESILLNVPIPVIYVAEDEENRWEVVDGLQRLNSLHRFFQNEFKLQKLEVLDELIGVKYKDLNPKAARILRNGILRIIMIFKESHSDIKYEIFMRLNQGAVSLSEQELRNCLYRGPFNDMLHELRSNKDVLTMLGLPQAHKRMADAELLLRHLTIKNGYNRETGGISTYTGNMRSSLNRYMESAKKTVASELNMVKDEFLRSTYNVLGVFGNNAFHRIDETGNFDGRLNRAIMDAILVAFGYFDNDDLVSRKDDIKEMLRVLINEDVEFLDAITVRTSQKGKMEYRVHTFTCQLAKIIGG